MVGWAAAQGAVDWAANKVMAEAETAAVVMAVEVAELATVMVK